MTMISASFHSPPLKSCSIHRLPIFEKITGSTKDSVESPCNDSGESLSPSTSSSSSNFSGQKPASIFTKTDSEIFESSEDYKAVLMNFCLDCSPARVTSVLSKLGPILSASFMRDLFIIKFCSLKTAVKARAILSHFCTSSRLSEASPLIITNPNQYTGIRKCKSRVSDKECFAINLECGVDTRTTVMVKNIPNKYTQQMLMETIDQNFYGAYNFLYLPIDFQNKCNVGYAFINFKHPQYVADFCKVFMGRTWKRFNSKKVCSVAYARIQGLKALAKHFEKSGVMSQRDPRIKPVIMVN